MRIFKESLIITFWIGIGALALWGAELAGLLRTDSLSHPQNTFSIEIELPEVYQIWQRGEAVFVDARAPYHFNEGHIPGAVNVPVNRVKETLSVRFLQIRRFNSKPVNRVKETLSVLPTDKNAQLITYCGSINCPNAYQLMHLLWEEGYRNVQFFPSGIFGWEMSGYPLEGESALVSPASRKK